VGWCCGGVRGGVAVVKHRRVVQSRARRVARGAGEVVAGLVLGAVCLVAEMGVLAGLCALLALVALV
jgi:hypothetical protein